MSDIKVTVRRILKGLPLLILMITVSIAVVLWFIGVFIANEALSGIDSFWSFYNDPEFLNESLVTRIWTIYTIAVGAVGIVAAFMRTAYNMGRDHEYRQKNS